MMIFVNEVVMQPKPVFQPEYITDMEGNRKSIIISIEAYQELLEDIEDLAVLAERREEPSIAHAEVLADLKRNGYLPN